jgi:hypothetical protein
MNPRTTAALAIAARVAADLEHARIRARGHLRDPDIPLADRWRIFLAQPPGLLGDGEGELHLAALELPCPDVPTATLGLGWLVDRGERFALAHVPVLVENLGELWAGVDGDELRREILELGLSHWTYTT